MFYKQYGGLYLYVLFNNYGDIKGNDYCMVVGVMCLGLIVDGWSQNVNGFDSFSSDFDWFNKQYSYQFFFVFVWFK